MNEKIAKLCRGQGLGELLATPVPVSGGYLHKMLRVETARGIFAIKALNPDIMMRQEALENMRRGERINDELGMMNDELNVCASLSGVVEVEGSYFIVYPWVDGASVFAPEITVEHCRIMGDVLGRIHRAEVRILGVEPETDLRQPFDWSLVEDGRVAAWDAAALEGLRRLRAVQVISHRDLDPKNVLWQGMQPCIIDWEAAGYVNPWQELIELLNYWADDEEKASAMIAAYGAHRTLHEADWDAALAAGMDGMLGWLHYNLRRAKGLEGSTPQDRTEGEAHVRGTLAELEQYEQRAAFLRRVLG
ncbi:MAG: phosphotransferase [Clostridia bacterium]|nr:phosphotransferase [Clostridia bacterium]